MNFSRISNPVSLPEVLQGCVVAIGNFDGVHRGHQVVLQQALLKAHEMSAPAVVLTFEPHPRTFFKPDAPVFRLTNASVKAEIFRHMGFSAVIEIKFDAKFSSTSADDFIGRILLEDLGARHVVTGYDFHFGKGRQGNPQFLTKSGETLGFGTTTIEAFNDEGGEVISSSRIRQSIAIGDISTANGLLGYAYRVSGVVIKGKQLGRELGFPTANISLPAENELRHGIYAVRAIMADGVLRDGVASYGRRPTFDNGEALLETFLFDFSGDLYGQEMTTCLQGWIRGEEKFDSVEALIEQMNADCDAARAILASMHSGQNNEGNLWPILHNV